MSKNNLTRRDFVRLAGMGGAASLFAPASFAMEEAAKKSDIGATFILWGYGVEALEPSLRDMSQLGYHSFETFGHVIEKYEKEKGGIKDVIAKYGVPIVSAFCNGDVLDPSKRKGEVENLVKWSKLLKENGGKVIEYCAGGRRTKDFNFKDYQKNMIESMNEYGKVVADQGLVCALHPHTGTPVETEEEVYFVMKNVNTDYMKFGPDVGQLEKGGGDPVKICRDFLPLIEHVHLKDYSGGDNGYLGYAPLGDGKVKLKEILKMLEKRRNKMAGKIMFELDSDKRSKMPFSEYEAAKRSHDYLQKLGYKFKA